MLCRRLNTQFDNDYIQTKTSPKMCSKSSKYLNSCSNLFIQQASKLNLKTNNQEDKTCLSKPMKGHMSPHSLLLLVGNGPTDENKKEKKKSKLKCKYNWCRKTSKLGWRINNNEKYDSSLEGLKDLSPPVTIKVNQITHENRKCKEKFKCKYNWCGKIWPKKKLEKKINKCIVEGEKENTTMVLCGESRIKNVVKVNKMNLNVIAFAKKQCFEVFHKIKILFPKRSIV